MEESAAWGGHEAGEGGLVTWVLAARRRANRLVIVGLPTIRKLLNGEDVELESFRINLIPEDVLWNNREDVMLLFGDDVLTAQRVFKARELLGGKTDSRTTVVERRPAPAASKPEAAHE